jgi:hypothetical protein
LGRRGEGVGPGGPSVGRGKKGREAGHAREIGPREGLGCWAGLLSYSLSFSFSN